MHAEDAMAALSQVLRVSGLSSEESLPCALQGRCWIRYRCCLLLPVCFQEMVGSYPSATGNIHPFSKTGESCYKLYMLFSLI